MDLLARTLHALDWEVVLQALAGFARTRRGARLAGVTDLAADEPEILARYRAVAEVDRLEAELTPLPLHGISDLAPALARASRGGLLDAGELIEAGQCLRALVELRAFLEERADPAPTLHAMARGIEVDLELAGLLRRSFDEEGRLSAAEYPELGELRRQVEALGERIRRVLDELVQGEALAEVLQERFFTQREGRFVLPVRAERRRGLGIVHGRSQSGETVWVEPTAVVELHNERALAEAELRRQEERILATLSRLLGRAAGPLETALQAAAELDRVQARAALGRHWAGQLPEIGRGGCIDLRAARHPVLQLRGVAVVANDLRLDPGKPGLILSGPNAGGKTVALKTLGLCALLARMGVPLPAAEGSRVDLFEPILADIGDAQTVQGDLSTFSGHVAVLAALLAAIEGRGPGARPALVLLDELGMGTDPAQGAALARAMAETLVQAGARVAITTHFLQLKALAAVDPRFQVAAVAFEDGRPTWRVQVGAAGESHALEIARVMALPEAVLRRAEELLSRSERDLGELMARLEEERARLRRGGEELAARSAAAAERERALARREEAVEERRRELERRVSEGFLARMRGQEERVKQLVAALQRDPDLKGASEALQAVRQAMQQARPPAPAAPAEPPPAELRVGMSVLVPALNQKGRVLALLGEDRAEVEVGRMRMKLRRAELRGVKGEVFAAPPPPPPPPAPAAAPDGLRLQANTCDLRGLRVEEALEALDRFLPELARQGFSRGFVLHGHGGGALKAAVRAELPRRAEVARSRPAGVEEGGDAFTVVEIRANGRPRRE